MVEKKKAVRKRVRKAPVNKPTVAKVEEVASKFICPICEDKGYTEDGIGGLLHIDCVCGQKSNDRLIHIKEMDQPTKPPREPFTCSICKDTGFMPLGGGNRSFCKCGTETHEEHIGLIPRRQNMFGPPTPITQDEKDEADWRRTHGNQPRPDSPEPLEGNRPAGDSEDTVQPGSPEEPEAPEGGGDSDEALLPESGSGVPNEQGGEPVPPDGEGLI